MDMSGKLNFPPTFSHWKGRGSKGRVETFMFWGLQLRTGNLPLYIILTKINHQDNFDSKGGRDSFS